MIDTGAVHVTSLPFLPRDPDMALNRSAKNRKDRHVAATLIGLLLLAGTTQADPIQCEIKNSTGLPSQLIVDPTTKKAMAYFSGFGPMFGTVTLIRDHDGRPKYNIYIPSTKKLLGDEFEFVLSPTERGHRFFGVAYETIEGKRYISYNHGVYDAKCGSIAKPPSQ